MSVPYLEIINQSKHEHSFDSLIEKFGATSLRITYAMAFGHAGKILALDSSLFRLINQTIKGTTKHTYLRSDSPVLSDLFKGTGLNTLQRSLSLIRRKRTDLLTKEMQHALALLFS